MAGSGEQNGEENEVFHQELLLPPTDPAIARNLRGVFCRARVMSGFGRRTIGAYPPLCIEFRLSAHQALFRFARGVALRK
jgi:hypothetical protein